MEIKNMSSAYKQPLKLLDRGITKPTLTPQISTLHSIFVPNALKRVYKILEQ